jgi:hypothetical protein
MDAIPHYFLYLRRGQGDVLPTTLAVVALTDLRSLTRTPGAAVREELVLDLLHRVSRRVLLISALPGSGRTQMHASVDH